MTSRPSVRPRPWTGLAATLALVACAPPTPPAPAPAPPPPVALSAHLLQEASAYRSYVARAAQISPAFTDGGAVAQGLQTGAAYEPGQLLRGAMVYGAVAALQDPAFRTGLRTFATDPEQRRTVAYGILRNPDSVLNLPGAASAAGLAASALADDGQRLLNGGRAVKQAAYDVQHFSWSKSEVAGREARLALAKQLSSTPLAGDTAISSQLDQAVSGQTPLSLAAPAGTTPVSPLVVRATALAGLAALGYATDENLDQLTALAADPTIAKCLDLSKLNLYQCLAVAKPHYEDVFCLGQHALMETGACLIKGAGVATPAAAGPALTPSAPPRSAAVHGGGR